MVMNLTFRHTFIFHNHLSSSCRDRSRRCVIFISHPKSLTIRRTLTAIHCMSEFQVGITNLSEILPSVIFCTLASVWKTKLLDVRCIRTPKYTPSAFSSLGHLESSLRDTPQLDYRSRWRQSQQRHFLRQHCYRGLRKDKNTESTNLQPRI
jgi:hypothetical protein